MDDLNLQQRAAVEHRGGPLIVLAGPGTGKTRVIVARIARLVREEGAAPESVVAVTFTVKAAGELRERLRGLIGPAAADRVNAGTFHGFGLRLIRRFGDSIGVEPEPQLIDSAQRRRLLRGLIREHGLFERYAARGRESVIPEAERWMRALADRAIGPARCGRFAAEWGARCGADAGSGAGAEEGGDGALAERERQWWFAEVSRLYGLFDGACRERGWVTFDDLITQPIRILRERPGVAAICRDEWRHVVVDEFQDVNAAQVELLRLMAPPRGAGGGGAGPGLCVVGDDDQAIYGFRGADDRAFHRFAAIWTAHERIELTRNYRGAPCVVAVANQIIAKAHVRFAPGKRIEADAGRGAGVVECVELDDEKDDGFLIASMLLADRRGRAAAGQGGAAERAWSSYAVIGRSHSDLERIGAALGLEGIPVRLSRGPAVLGDRAVQDVLKWVELLAEPRAHWAAQWLLTRPPLSVPAPAVIEWGRRYRVEASRAAMEWGEGTASSSGSRESPGAFVDWVLARGGDHAGVRRLAEVYGRLRELAAHAPADAVVFEAIRLSGAAHAELLGGRERARRVANLAEVVRFVRSRVPALDPPGGIEAFWSYYQDLDESEKGFRGAGEERVDGDDDDEVEAHDGVRLLTAHGAKGLEFDTVFVPRVSPGHGYPKTAGADDRIVLPSGLAEESGGDEGGGGGLPERDASERRIDEERRTFYVACTRARERLVLLARRSKARSKSVHFFHELTRDRAGAGLVIVRDGGAMVGGNGAERDRLDAEAADARGFNLAAGAVRHAAERAKREARLDAARALEELNRPDVHPDELASATERLRGAAERLAVAAHIESRGVSPAWAGAGGMESDEGGGDADAGASGFRFQRRTAPLELTGALIDDYEKCPRCCYLRHFEGFPEPVETPRVVGQVAHLALGEFYRRWREAETGTASGESAGRPGLDELLRLGRRAFATKWPADVPVRPEQQEQVLAQLRLAHERLHHGGLEVLEVERRVTIPFVHGGVEHRLVARLDRLDRGATVGGEIGTAGFRVVDYRTGHGSKRVLRPEATDLTLGIHAMALRQFLGMSPDEAESVAGVAEYWVLSTGERGAIALGELNAGKLRARIARVVEGLLAGEFERGGDCWGLCGVLGEGAE